jgi:hypothetical protein
MRTLCAVALARTRTKMTKSFRCINSIGFWRFLYRLFTLAAFFYINSMGNRVRQFLYVNSMEFCVEQFLYVNSMENCAG